MGKGFHVDVVQEHLEKEAEVHFKYFSGHFAKVGQGGRELICCRFYWKSLTENHQMVDRRGVERGADDTGGRDDEGMEMNLRCGKLKLMMWFKNNFVLIGCVRLLQFGF